MGYEVKEMGPEDRQKVFDDLIDDERHRGYLNMRGGHFNYQTDLMWAIDSQRDSYLFWGPSFNLQGQGYNYFFYFKKKMHVVIVGRGLDLATVQFATGPKWHGADLDDLKVAVEQALCAYGITGAEQGLPRTFKFLD